MKILIAGGTGLIGQALTKKLVGLDHTVHILSRSEHKDEKNIQYFKWDTKKKNIDLNSFEEVDVLINLSGAGIADKKWTKSRKEVLINSRVEPNQLLLDTIKSNNISIKNFICSSGINCYGFDKPEQTRNETDDYGNDFLSKIVRLWEESALNFSDVCPVNIIRTSVVLSPKGGALDQLSKLVKWRLGSYIGSGKQYMPWIHIDDLTNIFIHLLSSENQNIFNANADQQVTNRAFMKKLNTALGKRPFVPPAPSWAVKMILGEMSEMILKGVKVSNEKIKNSGYQFEYSTIEKAFEDIYSK